MNRNTATCILLLILLLVSEFSFAQINKTFLPGSWIKSKVEFIDGVQLPDEDALKHQYTKFNFGKNQVGISTAFNSKGTLFGFKLAGNIIDVFINRNFKSNSYLIEKLTATELILLQKGSQGFKQEDVLRIYLINEQHYQNTWQVKADDIFAISNNDTVFKAHDRLYPTFNNSLALHDYITGLIPEFNNVSSSSNYFLASYIVRKNGTVDDIKVLERINGAFDNQVVKALNQTSQKWIPAKLHGRPVDVQMTESFRFLTAEQAIPFYDYDDKGHEALREKKYEEALYFFSKAVEKVPSNMNAWLNIAMCKIYLGHPTAACADLQKIKKSNSGLQVDEIIAKYCK